MGRALFLTVLLLILLFRSTVNAGDLQVTFENGRVTIVATEVSIQKILMEWTKVGSTQFVGISSLSRGSLVLKLIEVSELDALRILLRNAAGYVAAPKTTSADEGSRFGKVLVMATRQDISESITTTSVQSQFGGLIPAQLMPGSVNSERFSSDIDRGQLIEEIEDLQDFLPESFGMNERLEQEPDQSFPTFDILSAPRPGIVIDQNDAESPVFIRRPNQFEPQ